jgi:MtN3 and saliva related transmembrane protein
MRQKETRPTASAEKFGQKVKGHSFDSHWEFMESVIYGVGLTAAALTSLSYLPQVLIPRGATHNLSLKTMVALAAGLALWVCYGLPRSDLVIIFANGVGLALALTLVGFILRDRRAGLVEPIP